MVSTLSDRIRRARRVAHLSCSELGRRVGVRPSAAIQWEQIHGTSPSVENLIRIAQITDTAFEWLATGRGPARLVMPQETPAVLASAFAQDVFEEALLLAARKIPERKKDALLRFVEAMAS